MPRKLKYFGGRLLHRKTGELRRAIIAASSKAAAVRAIPHMTMYEFNNFWGQTGNDQEIEILRMSEPETPFINIGAEYGEGRNYVKWED